MFESSIYQEVIPISEDRLKENPINSQKELSNLGISNLAAIERYQQTKKEHLEKDIEELKQRTRELHRISFEKQRRPRPQGPSIPRTCSDCPFRSGGTAEPRVSCQLIPYSDPTKLSPSYQCILQAKSLEKISEYLKYFEEKHDELIEELATFTEYQKVIAAAKNRAELNRCDKPLFPFLRSQNDFKPGDRVLFLPASSNQPFILGIVTESSVEEVSIQEISTKKTYHLSLYSPYLLHVGDLKTLKTAWLYFDLWLSVAVSKPEQRKFTIALQSTPTKHLRS